MASLLSINGELATLYNVPGGDTRRSTGYVQVDLGRPIVVRYLRRVIRIDPRQSRDRDKLLVSTWVKTREEKAPVAEAVTYYNDNAQSLFDDNGIADLEDFGGRTYGHELCYYAKSYRGESIRLTSSVQELDRSNFGNLAKALGQVAAGGATRFPALIPLLPYITAGVSFAKLLTDVFNFMNRDDVISTQDLDLHFDRPHARRIQSGRIVCIPDSEHDEDFFLQRTDGLPLYRLGDDNRLLERRGTGDAVEWRPYTAESYFVLQIDARPHTLYENFDHYKGAAEILAATNRSEGPGADVVALTAGLMSNAADIAAIRRIESLSINAADETVAKKIIAEYAALSSDVQLIFRERLNQILNRD